MPVLLTAVVGAHFGDEGKGLVTDYVATQSKKTTLVVRFNGGAQAGHTVETPCGLRHVFRHMGSGSFTGASTCLSRFFIVDPLIFKQEHQTLLELGLAPRCYVDARARVATPYDVAINRILEDERGDAKHGSCGLGIGETVERCLSPEYSLTVSDLMDRPGLVKKLKAIHHEWLPWRLKQLNITSLSNHWKQVFALDLFWKNYLVYVDYFLDNTSIKPIKHVLSQYEHIVFEGAQGLLLDQEKGYFPHVTRSYTGLRHVVEFLQEQQLDNLPLEVFYVSRVYVTRHGAGPLPEEVFKPLYSGVLDKTNVFNAYQGALRYGWFNLDTYAASIHDDLQDVPAYFDVRPKIAMTCLDHVDSMVSYWHNHQLLTVSVQDFLGGIIKHTGFLGGVCSFGPTREDVRYIKSYA
jgi:adenylosuccinate synthase